MNISNSFSAARINNYSFKSNNTEPKDSVNKNTKTISDAEKERNFIKGMYGSALVLMLVPLAVEQGVNIKYNYDTKNHLEEIYSNPQSKDGKTISLEEYQQMEEILKTKKESAERLKLRLKERSELEKYHHEMLDEYSNAESEDGVNISPYEQNKLDYKFDDKADELVPYIY